MQKQQDIDHETLDLLSDLPNAQLVREILKAFPPCLGPEPSSHSTWSSSNGLLFAFNLQAMCDIGSGEEFQDKARTTLQFLERYYYDNCPLLNNTEMLKAKAETHAPQGFCLCQLISSMLSYKASLLQSAESSNGDS